MQIQWFSNLKDPKDKEAFKQYLLGSQKLLDRLKEICYNRIQDRGNTKESDYDSPSWAYLQADRNGYVRAYQEILKLCEIEDHDQ
jgi:hypothetical protein